MLTGIKSKLKEEITKHSSTLGRDAKYTKTVSKLPINCEFVDFGEQCTQTRLDISGGISGCPRNRATCVAMEPTKPHYHHAPF